MATKVQKKATNTYKRKCKSPLSRFVHEIEAYNAEHGTAYTYGKYVAYKYFGRI